MTTPLKKGKNSPNFCIFTQMNSLLSRQQLPKEVTQILKWHVLLNGPHLVSPKLPQEVTGPHILKEISYNFRTIHKKDPVFLIYNPSKNQRSGKQNQKLAVIKPQVLRIQTRQ